MWRMWMWSHCVVIWIEIDVADAIGDRNAREAFSFDLSLPNGLWLSNGDIEMLGTDESVVHVI